MMPKKPINTRQEAQDSPEMLFMEALISGGTSGMIERQEKQGQSSFVGSDTLPTEISEGDKDTLIQMGVKFGSVVEGDDIFQYVELPQGWKKESTDHSMWSYLIDAAGKKVASIFYKAAFYDRSAFLRLGE